MVVWIILGILIPVISVWVHEHTYFTTLDEKGTIVPNIRHRVPFPKWLYVTFIIMGIIPIVNVVAFFSSVIIYVLGMIMGDYTLIGAPKFIDKIIKKITHD